jgi:glycosyltransferase involved in cell wall biosynthesis
VTKERTCGRTPVVFIGSFRDSAPDGAVGGQMVACRSLLKSTLSDRVRWILIDSTMESLPPPPIWRRILLAAKRVARVAWVIYAEHPSGAVIFSSFNVPSLLEKVMEAKLLQMAGARVVVSIRSEVKAHLASLPLVFLRRGLLESADVVVCQSERARSALSAAGKPGSAQLEVLPNWIDVAALAKVPAHPGIFRTGRGPVFVFVGWLESYKGVWELTRAFERLAGELPGAQLEFCGLGREYEALTKYVRAKGLEGRIRFHGWLGEEAKMRLLAESDIFVLPSHTEGMPNALLEAMAAGRPVIASRVGGIPEMVVDGVSGVLVEAGDVEGLTLAMLRLARSPELCREMGAEGRGLAQSRHDVRQASVRFAHLLRLEGEAYGQELANTPIGEEAR